MVEFLYTSPADHTVEGFNWFDYFTVETEILQVYIFIITYFQQFYHVHAWINETWIHKTAQREKYQAKYDYCDCDDIEYFEYFDVISSN